MRKKPLFFIKMFVVALVVLLMGFYFFRQSKPFLAGPQISVTFPQNGQVLENSTVSIKGVVLNVTTLLLNDRAVLADASGSFNESLILAKGYNIIELSAEDKFGRSIVKKLEVVLK